MDGTYGFVYCGNEGVGLGIITVVAGKLVGQDLSGTKYRGTLQKNAAGGIIFAVEQTVPTGAFLVQGTSPQGLPYTRSFSHELPADFADGKPMLMGIPPSPITITMRRISEEYGAYADGVDIRITPSTAGSGG